MEGVAALGGKEAVCLDGDRLVTRLQAHYRSGEARLLKPIEVGQGGIAHQASRGIVPFGKGAAVEPDPDGSAMVLGRGEDLIDFPAGPDIARIDPDLVRPALDRLQGELVVEVDVSHHRDGTARAQVCEGAAVIALRVGEADDITAHRIEAADTPDQLIERFLAVGQTLVVHRLHQGREPDTQQSITDENLTINTHGLHTLPSRS